VSLEPTIDCAIDLLTAIFPRPLGGAPWSRRSPAVPGLVVGGTPDNQPARPLQSPARPPPAAAGAQPALIVDGAGHCPHPLEEPGRPSCPSCLRSCVMLYAAAPVGLTFITSFTTFGQALDRSGVGSPPALRDHLRMAGLSVSSVNLLERLLRLPDV